MTPKKKKNRKKDRIFIRNPDPQLGKMLDPDPYPDPH